MNFKHSRSGFSLLEILLALAILGGSLAVLSQIASTGVAAAREARELGLVRVLCQAKMSELLLNATLGQTPTSVFDMDAEPFDSQSTAAFVYSIEIQPAPYDGMLMVRVTATASDSNGGVLARYALDRWMVDPDLGLEEAELEEEEARAIAAGTAEETT